MNIDSWEHELWLDHVGNAGPFSFLLLHKAMKLFYIKKDSNKRVSDSLKHQPTSCSHYLTKTSIFINIIMRFSTLSKSVITIATIMMMPTSTSAGPIAYGICQTGCNSLVVACYAAAGFTFGTVVASAATPAVLLACNVGLGTCSATCATVALLAPTP